MPENPTDDREPGRSATRENARSGGGVETTVDPARAGRTEDVDRTRPVGSPTVGSDSAESTLEREILDPEERAGPDEQYCVHCDALFDTDTDACPDCGHPYPGQVDPPASTRKNPTVAGLLSAVLPGAGQLYNEQFGRGLLAFVGTVVLVGTIALTGLVADLVVTIVSLGLLSTLGTVILLLAVAFGWLLPASVAAWDAYDQAKKF